MTGACTNPIYYQGLMKLCKNVIENLMLDFLTMYNFFALELCGIQFITIQLINSLKLSQTRILPNAEELGPSPYGPRCSFRLV